MSKLFRYFDFIIEAAAKKTVPLFYSEKFRSLLKKIEKKSRYAKFLLGAEDSNQIADTSTLIDVTDKNDMISFIQLNRILRAEPDTHQSDDGNYFLSRKITNDETHKFWKEGRTEVGIGKWTRRIITEVYKSTVVDSDLEQFVNLYKAAYDGNEIENFELVSGEEIRKWYHLDNYNMQRGQLGNSCMRYTRCQPYLDIYVKNPNQVALLILKNDTGDKIHGRALIWKLRDPVNGSTHYMDRIYTTHDSDRILFEEWAESRNMIKYPTNKTLFVQLESGDFDLYPYMDSFICYNPSSLLLTNDEDLWPGHGYDKLQSTDGTYESGDATWSEYYSDYITGDNIVWCENIDSYIYDTDAVYLNYKDEWAYPNDDIIKSNYDDEWYHEGDLVFSDILEDYIWKKHKNLVKLITAITDMPRFHDWTVKDRPDTYIEKDGIYYSKKLFMIDPYTKELKSSEDSEYSKKLAEKIINEIFPGEGVSIEFDKINDKIEQLWKEGKFDKESVIKSIQDNRVYKEQIQGVYWGLKKEQLLSPEEMIPLIISFQSKQNTESKTHRMFLDNGLLLMYGKNVADIETRMVDGPRSSQNGPGDKYVKIFRYDYQYFGQIQKLCKVFDWASFGGDIYKLIILKNLEE